MQYLMLPLIFGTFMASFALDFQESKYKIRRRISSFTYRVSAVVMILELGGQPLTSQNYWVGKR